MKSSFRAKTSPSPLPSVHVRSPWTTKLIIRIVMLAVAVCSLQAQIDVTVFPQVQNISAPQGHVFKTAPSLASATHSTVNEPAVVHVKAYTDTTDGRFFLSEASYEKFKSGKVGYWIYIPTVSNAGGAAPAPQPNPALSDIRVYQEVQNVPAPQGHVFKAGPSLRARTTRTVNEAATFHAKAYLDTPEGRFFLSESSFEKVRNGTGGAWAYIVGVSNTSAPAPPVSPEQAALLAKILEYKEVHNIPAPQGHVFKAGPSMQSRTTLVVKEAATFHAKAYLDTPEGRFFLSESSLQKVISGTGGQWAYIKGESNQMVNKSVLNNRWAKYLKEIQDDNAYPNWSGPPYDLNRSALEN